LLSQILNFPQVKIRVYKAQIGGGFGNKQEILSEDLWLCVDGRVAV
jgi:CO/xanthine dehydrogenase Mo-binding subunit